MWSGVAAIPVTLVSAAAACAQAASDTPLELDVAARAFVNVCTSGLRDSSATAVALAEFGFSRQSGIRATVMYHDEKNASFEMVREGQDISCSFVFGSAAQEPAVFATIHGELTSALGRPESGPDQGGMTTYRDPDLAYWIVAGPLNVAPGLYQVALAGPLK
jgi:hypothetical protein